ncbi:MAG: FHA domain-containing protein [Anaerolineae bacterium]|nr:FHA domain-containing protein [Anaerolineae bacterium]
MTWDDSFDDEPTPPDDAAETADLDTPASRPAGDSNDMLNDLRRQIADEDAAIPAGFIELFINGETEPLRLELEDQLLLGRFTERFRDVKGYLDLTAHFERGISRRHAVIRRTAAGAVLVDLGSSNGTCLNDNPLTPNKSYPLKNGDRITLGDLVIYVYM